MSRTLSKWMIICALIVIIPLTVVGATFASYYSIDATVALDLVFANGVTADAASDAYARIVCNNAEVKEKQEVVAAHTKTLTLRAEAKGYDFIGWFAGDENAYEQNIATEISKNPTIKVKMEDFGKVVAVFDIQKFTVKYSYSKADSTVEGSTTVDPEDGLAEKVYNYGDLLPNAMVMEDAENNPEKTFCGWYLREDETVGVDISALTHYERATFAKAESITLRAEWKLANQYKVSYLVNGAEVNSVNIYETQTETLDSVDAYATEDGYRYFWAVENAEVTKVVKPKADVTVELRKTEVVYTATISGVEGIASTLTSVNFTVNNTTALEAIFDETNWETDYSFWKFNGINSYADASAVVAAATSASKHSTTNVELTANAPTKEFTSFTSTNGYVFKFVDSGVTLDDYGVYHSDLSTTLDKNIEWDTDDTTNTFAQYLMIDATDLYAAIKDTKDDSTKVAISTVEVTLKNAGVTVNIAVENIASINDIIEKIYTEYDGKYSSNETQMQVYSITLICEEII